MGERREGEARRSSLRWTWNIALLAGLPWMGSFAAEGPKGAAPARAAQQPGRLGPGALVRAPVSVWWTSLSSREQRAVLLKHPLLAESLAFHKKLIPQEHLLAHVTDKALGDWWLGLDGKIKARLMGEQPRLLEAVKRMHQQTAGPGAGKSPDSARRRK